MTTEEKVNNFINSICQHKDRKLIEASEWDENKKNYKHIVVRMTDVLDELRKAELLSNSEEK